MESSGVNVGGWFTACVRVFTGVVVHEEFCVCVSERGGGREREKEKRRNGEVSKQGVK
jgi:hypothetical protein